MSSVEAGSASQRFEDRITSRRRSSWGATGRMLRRRWRCFKRMISHHGVRFVHGPGYRCSVAGVPMDMLRGDRILVFLSEEGLVDSEDIVIPQPVSVRNLLRVHTADYIEATQDAATLVRIFGVDVSDATAQDLVSMQRAMVGGTIQASRLARRSRGVVVNLGGGLHHGHHDSGMAFCIFNDVAVAVARLRARGFGAPVLVVDLDMHDGNGTRSIFALDPTVHTYSIHNEHWGETEVTAATSIALGDGVADDRFLGALVKSLPQVVEKVDPGLVFYIAGTDGAADDALGSWKLSAEGIASRDRFVFDLLRRRRSPVPLVVLLGGGYGDRTWAYSARFLATALAGRTIIPPPNEELTLTRFRRIAGELDPASLTSEPGDFSWRLTADDLAGIMPGVPRRTRFLGHFSEHGLELALERFGILDRLRLARFDRPTIELDLGQALGDTLRIWSGPDRKELLMELRVDRNRRLLPGLEVLTVEWLLLQNPRAEFGPFRRPLPGQKYPGLGLLKEILGFLVMLSEILELDGVAYVPSSYHVMAQSQRLVRFLRAEDAARFKAVHRAVGHLPLAQASRLVAEGKVLDNLGNPLEWRGVPMVLPVSRRLEETVGGEEYDARVEEALAAMEFTLAPGADVAEVQ